MDRLAAFVLTLAAAAFAGSLMRFGAVPHLMAAAMAPGAIDPGLPSTLPMGLAATIVPAPSALPVLGLQMIGREHTLPWLLMIVVCVGMGLHVIHALTLQWRAEQAAAARRPRTAAFLGAGDVGPWTPEQITALHARATRVTEYGPLALALAAAAAWPWVSLENATAGFVAAAVAMIAALVAVIRGERDGVRIRHSVAVGLFAGWITAVAFASFIGVLTRQAGVPDTLAAVVTLILCGLAGTWVQWQLGRPIAYALGLISALVGIAILTMNHDPITAMAAILAIAGLAVTVVRSAT